MDGNQAGPADGSQIGEALREIGRNLAFSWHPEAARDRAVVLGPLTCAAAIPAVTRHARTRTPTAPAFRLRVMRSLPLDWTARP